MNLKFISLVSEKGNCEQKLLYPSVEILAPKESSENTEQYCHELHVARKKILESIVQYFELAPEKSRLLEVLSAATEQSEMKAIIHEVAQDAGRYLSRSAKDHNQTNNFPLQKEMSSNRLDLWHEKVKTFKKKYSIKNDKKKQQLISDHETPGARQDAEGQILVLKAEIKLG